MVGVQSIPGSHRLLSTAHNLLILLPFLITFVALPTTTSTHPQQPHPSSFSSSLTNPTTPTQCNIQLERSWCPTDQSCFITPTTFQCHPTSITTSGWIITSRLNIAFLNPSPSQLLLSNATCLPLPVPASNSTHQEILILALKRHDDYYRTSTILISDDPASILRGVSTCKNPMERCVDGWCAPVLGYGDICRGNDECYNPPRSFNSTKPYNVNMSDEPEKSNETTRGGGGGNEPFGLICDYETGKLDQPPKCINYIRANPRPDADQNMNSPDEPQKKWLYWVFAIVALVVIVVFVLAFMCWRKTHGQSNSGGGGGGGEDGPQQTHYQPYDGGDPETAGGVRAGEMEKCTEYLSDLRTPGAVGQTGPAQESGRRGSTSSQNSAHSTVSWRGNGCRLSVAEKMMLDCAQDHEFMNRMSQSRPPGTFHRIEQLATNKGAGSAGIRDRVGPLSMGPSRRSMSVDPMQIYPATAPASEGRGEGRVGGSGHALVHQLQEPSPPPNTPENQLPPTIPSLQ